VKICPECGRNYADDAVVCAYDGTPLSSGSTVGWERPAVSEPQTGDVLGVYRILAKLGEGGMGMIYRAEHVRLGRQVVLKVLKPELARRTELVGRFFGEARAVNEIGHPNIVDIIDFVEVGDQDPPLVYMVMELLKGEDLASRIRSAGPLDPEEAVEVGCQVADALTAVHRVKILHRRGHIEIAERAEALLRAEGCETTVERGNEGGQWEPFWGHVYYFRDDLADETEIVRGLLRELGYLDAEHVTDDPDLDLVVWLDP